MLTSLSRGRLLRTLAMMVLLPLTACDGARGADEPPPTPTGSPGGAPTVSPSPADRPDPAAVGANELGQIPVLMIHRVAEDATGDYGQTPEQFRETLEYLASHDYVPVTAADLASAVVDIPAGTSPVVLTFDDGYADQFQLLPDGSVDPDTAVGIMLEVAAEYPDFPPVGTMYVNRDPFGRSDPAPELEWLVANGWEVGNHTAGHANLRALDPDGVQRELVKGEKAITEAVPGYQVTTLSLPFGALPRQEQLAHTGSWKGHRYDYRGVMLVGAGPAPSPFHGDWDPFGIPRIRSWGGQVEADQHYWLPRLEETRYVSDGDPEVISFPESAAGDLAPAYQERAHQY